MPPESRSVAAAWLRRARSNLARARSGRVHPDILYEDLCFDAQQAAEKAIKAVLASYQIGFPRTHDIVSLLSLLDTRGVQVPEDIRAADALTQYAVEARYPGLSEVVTAEEYASGLQLAERVVRWAQTLINSGTN